MGVAKKKAPARGTQRAEANPQEALHEAQPEVTTVMRGTSMTEWLGQLELLRNALLFQNFQAANRILNQIIESMRKEADDGR